MVNYYSEKSTLSINELIENNLELVKKIAWQIFGRVQKVVEVEDLIQQGMEGLVFAAQKYSPKDGVTFQQYAQLRIRGSIIDFLRKNSNLCRTTIKKKQEFEKKKFELQKLNGKEPSKEDLVKSLGLTYDEFNYWESFDKHGMIYPITVSPHTEEWVQERLKRGKTPQHLLEDGNVRPGLYVQTGNKRVYWARLNNYTHIEGYYVTDREDKAKIRSKLHIPHTEIPR